MVRSMTGFGSAEQRRGALCVQVEVKCVNHRFLDVSMKLPRHYATFETDLKKSITEEIARGRVEVYVGRAIDPSGSESRATGRSRSKSRSDAGVRKGASLNRVVFDQALFEELCDVQLRAVERAAPLGTVSPEQKQALAAEVVRDILRRQEVCSTVEPEPDREEEFSLVASTLQQALARVQEMQGREGEALAAELRQRLAHLSELKSRVRERAAHVQHTLREKLIERVRKLAPEVVLDEARVAAEVVLLADRSDITEELVRLESHLDQFAEALAREPSGKRFDFLLQEIHREFNTIGSKAQDADMQRMMIESKVEIEKLREQVQNIA